MVSPPLSTKHNADKYVLEKLRRDFKAFMCSKFSLNAGSLEIWMKQINYKEFYELLGELDFIRFEKISPSESKSIEEMWKWDLKSELDQSIVS